MQPEDSTHFDNWSRLLRLVDADDRPAVIETIRLVVDENEEYVGHDTRCQWAKWFANNGHTLRARSLYEGVLAEGGQSFEVFDGLAHLAAPSAHLDAGLDPRLEHRLQSIRLQPGNVEALRHLSELLILFDGHECGAVSGDILSLLGQTHEGLLSAGEAARNQNFSHLTSLEPDPVSTITGDIDEHPLSLLFDGLLMVVEEQIDSRIRQRRFEELGPLSYSDFQTGSGFKRSLMHWVGVTLNCRSRQSMGFLSNCLRCRQPVYS